MPSRLSATEQTCLVMMRDGVRLATDVYRPAGAGEQRLPVVLERTPYNKSGTSRSEMTAADPTPLTRPELATWFANQGYAVVMQDCRGRYQSEGVFHKYIHEAEDGFDTLAWLLEQPWCNGRIGTMGLSYGAHTQAALACLSPPGLACMFMDSGGFSSAYHGGIRRGGAFELKQATWAYRHALKSPLTAADPARRKALEQTDLAAWFREMPWSPGKSPLAAAPEYETYLFELWREGRFSDYWKRPGLYAEGYYDRFPDVPVAIIGSWYDPYVLACTSNYVELAAKNTAPASLIMGPWTHGDRSLSWSGDADFGPSAILDGNIADDYRALRLGWFNRWLKDDASEPLPAPVRYFCMGGGSGRKNAGGRIDHGGHWLEAPAWPPPGGREEPLYLAADGSLKRHSEAALTRLAFHYDPADPVPTIGGALTSGAPIMHGGAFDQRVGDTVFTYRLDHDHLPLADRLDVLSFASPVLQDDLLVAGSIVVELHVGSDSPDTDFTAKILDVYPPSVDYPEGYAMNITDGIFRMRYRSGWEREVAMTAGEVYCIRIEPFATCNLFRAGHCLRIDISSSNYPHFDINRNTGMPFGGPDAARIATNIVCCGGEFRSRIILPVASA